MALVTESAANSRSVRRDRLPGAGEGAPLLVPVDTTRQQQRHRGRTRASPQRTTCAPSRAPTAIVTRKRRVWSGRRTCVIRVRPHNSCETLGTRWRCADRDHTEGARMRRHFRRVWCAWERDEIWVVEKARDSWLFHVSSICILRMCYNHHRIVGLRHAVLVQFFWWLSVVLIFVRGQKTECYASLRHRRGCFLVTGRLLIY